MLSVHELEQKSDRAAWVRGKAYFRNRLVLGLAVTANGPDILEVRAEIRAVDSYTGCLRLTSPELDILDWHCSCPRHNPRLCRHLVAIGLEYLLQRHEPGLAEWLDNPAERTMRQIEGTRSKPETHIFLQYQKPGDRLTILPRLIYRNAAGRKFMSINPYDPETPASESQPDERTYLLRDYREEQRVLAYFSQWPALRPNHAGYLELDSNDCLSILVNQIMPGLPTDWHILYDAELEKIIPQSQVIAIHFSRFRTSKLGFFSFDLSFQCGQLSITPEQLLAFLKSQHEWLRVNGQYIEVTNRSQLNHLFLLLAQYQREQSAGSYSGRVWQASDLAIWADESAEPDLPDSDPSGAKTDHAVWSPEFTAFLQGLSGDKSEISPEIPNPISRILRPYQADGVRWLMFLQTYGLGGILADDMGLGKTLQVLTLLTSAKPGRPSLLICPKTLMVNWLHEARKFTPGLKVILISGNQVNRRLILRRAADYDLVITSYPLYQQDLQVYLDLGWSTCILDEAQMIKNPETHLARNVKKIIAAHRLALTGTPMENDLLDLWSLFDFVMPGFLGKRESFRSQFSDGNLDKLVRKIRPFMLRRTKAQVLPDLPPKIEETVYTALTQNQLALYQQVLMQTKQNLYAAIADQGIAKAQMTILAGLTRLRQVCDHPGLLHPQYRSGSGISGKLDLLTSLLNDSLDNRHKVLVFSQFTQMLAIIRQYLENKQIPFCYLDGQTENRQAAVDQFNRDPASSVFLISLKAGGFGINLTAADTVILFDPWWNPMVEDQAADRAHRLGQSKIVSVYRLLTQGTIEEKMELLQKRKRMNFDGVINQAGSRQQALTLADLQFLLEDNRMPSVGTEIPVE